MARLATDGAAATWARAASRLIARAALAIGLAWSGAGCGGDDGAGQDDGADGEDQGDDDGLDDDDVGDDGDDDGDGSGFRAIPLIAPPVREATPAGFDGGRARLLGAPGFTAQAFRDRFFMGGPTDVQGLLTSVDDRIAEVNTMAMAMAPACADLEPVEYELTPWGQSEPFYAQCYRMTGTPTAVDPAFMQFGQKDGFDYLYVAGGAARLAARVRAIEGTDGFDVMLWYGVGYDNGETCGDPPAFDGCSYGVTQLHADSSAGLFEIAVAGIGVGFCGIRLTSDQVAIYGEGSSDMGETCNEPATMCVDAVDLETPSSCEPAPVLELPAIGRLAASGSHESGASTYPEVPNILLDGTTGDSLHFGPEAPTEGVGEFAMPAP
jgi:hypothetical protein